mgnify:CR=1 FL=1
MIDEDINFLAANVIVEIGKVKKERKKRSLLLRGAYATIAIIVSPFGAFLYMNLAISGLELVDANWFRYFFLLKKALS